MLAIAKNDLVRKIVQYPITYVFSEKPQWHSKGHSSVNVVKKKDDALVNGLQIMNGKFQINFIP